MRRALLLVLASLAGCSNATELVVVTESDLAIPDDLDAVRLEIAGPRGEMVSREAHLVGQGSVIVPFTLVVLHESGPLGPVEIVAIAQRSGAEVVRAEAVAWFVVGRSVLVPLSLSSACRDVVCPPELRCVDGECVERELPRDDGGTPIDGGVDAATPPVPDAGVDAGPTCPVGCECVQWCESGCQCAAGCGCALTCRAGEECTSGKCKDSGTTCALSARGAARIAHTCEAGATCSIDAREVSNVDRVVCKTGARCELDCTGASNCELECADDASCLVDCSGSSNCFISQCGQLDDDESAHRSCGDGIYVCNRSCP